jgi:hypothetical protein
MAAGTSRTDDLVLAYKSSLDLTKIIFDNMNYLLQVQQRFFVRPHHDFFFSGNHFDFLAKSQNDCRYK